VDSTTTTRVANTIISNTSLYTGGEDSILTAPASTDEKPWERYSNIQQTLHIISWCQRFINNCTVAVESRRHTKNLHTEEVMKTKEKLIILEQEEHFPEGLIALQRNMPLPKGHAFRKFRITKSSTGVLLLATRVRDSRDASQPRTLIPLSLKSTLTKQLIASLHRQHLHPGTNTLLAIIGESYHIPALHTHLKGPSRYCPQCQRAYDKGTQHSMGLLPSNRTTLTPPFHTTGIDFAGPFVTQKGHTQRMLLSSFASAPKPFTLSFAWTCPRQSSWLL